jgi:hypothetical protein
MSWFTSTLGGIADNRLILRLASFDVFAAFDAWHYGNLDFLGALIHQPWLRWLPIAELRAQISVDLIAPITIAGMGGAVALLLALHARRRPTRLNANLRRFRHASEHALEIDRRLAAECADHQAHPLLANAPRRSKC